MTVAVNYSPLRRRSFSPLASLAQMHAVWRQRQSLRKLDDAALADIGLTRREAEREASRPIWDAPTNWTC